MRRRSDYRFEMFNVTVSEQEIERLLTGTPAGNGPLSDLAVFVDEMRGYAAYISSGLLVDRVAAEAATLALAARESAVAGTKVSRSSRRRWPALSPRAAVAALSVVMVVGMAGVAAAADSAAPGDPLYGLDRALERIGIGAGSAAERLEEADQLLTEGQTLQALEHATEAVDGDAAASAALDIAIDRVATAANENSAAVQEKVDALFTFMSENIGKDNGVDGRYFGQGIAEIARGIEPAGSGAPIDGEDDGPAPADDPPPGIQNRPDEGERPGPSNQGTGNGSSDPPGSGGNQGNENSGNGSQPGTGGNQGGGNSDPPGNSGASGSGNGPPADSPSVTDPDRGNRP